MADTIRVTTSNIGVIEKGSAQPTARITKARLVLIVGLTALDLGPPTGLSTVIVS